ncbi:MAG: nifJ [Bacteroidetes bacterium]|nr:nifJ [Bacteroidota bacterium]
MGREYKLFQYVGSPTAEKVIVIMGSGAEAAQEALEYMNTKGANLGLLKVHLYRPFSVKHFLAALPPTVKQIAVLDRTKEPGSLGEPLYLDVVSALNEGIMDGTAPVKTMPRVIGGRYGLSKLSRRTTLLSASSMT